MEIKSSKVDESEIGYWVSEKHSGLASNAVSELIKIAKMAGYKLLYAQTKSGNKRSENVLKRNLFTEDGSFLRNKKNCDCAFKRIL